MRFRRSVRRARGRREPQSWSRASFQAAGGIGVGSITTSLGQASPVAGVVLFDPVVTQGSTLADYRTTVRRIRVPTAPWLGLNVVPAAGANTNIVFAAVTLLTGEDVSTFVSGAPQLDDTLSAEDILDIRVAEYTFFPGSGIPAPESFDSSVPWDIRVNRKVTSMQKIVQLYYLSVGGFSNIPPASTVTLLVNGIISVLWQRTLR